MIQHILFASLIVAMFGVAVFGQTPADLQRKYGTPSNIFEVRPGILMSVKWGDDGQVSEMIVEQRHTTDAAINLNSTLPDATVQELIDELAPIERRGKRIDKAYKDKFYLDSDMSGNLIETNRRYKHFTITLIRNLSASREASGTVVLIIKRSSPEK